MRTVIQFHISLILWQNISQRHIQRKREEKGKGGKEEIRAGEKRTERERKERTRNKEEI